MQVATRQNHSPGVCAHFCPTLTHLHADLHCTSTLPYRPFDFVPVRAPRNLRPGLPAASLGTTLYVTTSHRTRAALLLPVNPFLRISARVHPRCPLAFYTVSPPRSLPSCQLSDMAMQRPVTPSASYQSVPQVDDPAHLGRGYGTGTNDFASSPPAIHYDRSRLGRFEEDFDAPTRGTSVIDGDMHPRSSSRSSTLNQGLTPSRGGTLKKKGSIKRSGSLKRSGSRKSLHAGSIRGVAIDDQERGYDRENSVFHTPVPTKGSPTEILAERFQSMLSFGPWLNCSLTCRSLAQVPKRSHYLFPRGRCFL